MPYYVIKPNADLQALLTQSPQMSLPPRLLKVDSAPSGLSDQEAIEIHKLFHLAGMSDYLSILADPDELGGAADNEKRLRKYQFMKTLLGDPPYTRALFDRWWTIEKINAMTLYDEALKRLPLTALEPLEENASDGIAAWLDRTIDSKREKKG
jgi:hypothetical protein